MATVYAEPTATEIAAALGLSPADPQAAAARDEAVAQLTRVLGSAYTYTDVTTAPIIARMVHDVASAIYDRPTTQLAAPTGPLTGRRPQWDPLATVAADLARLLPTPPSCA